MEAIIQAIIPLLPTIIAILPFVAAGVSYWVQRTNNSTAKNTTIASATVLVCVVITALLQGKLTGNPTADVGYVLATAIALQAEVLGPIQQYLRGVGSKEQPEPTPSEPQPIILPPNGSEKSSA